MSSLPLNGTFHHAAVVVSSLQDSVDFYTRCLGGEVELMLEGIGEGELAQVHGLPHARFDLAYIRYGTARIELLQFHEPEQGATRHPAANEVGAAHIAFELDDVHGAYDRLTEAGAKFSRAPLELTEGDAAGYVLAFFYDPDGNRIELFSPPPAR
jgi:catechol 2,3-dioxygenase-like lactoylglutathione lyase family enzyme